MTRSDPRSEEAAGARGLLLSLYHRAGHFGRALAEIDALLAAYPDNESLEGRARALRCTRPVPRSVRRPAAAVDDPLQDEGRQPVRAGLDPRPPGPRRAWTRARTFSLMSESEARRLGLAIQEGGASVTDITGGSMGVRTAVADDRQVGGRPGAAARRVSRWSATISSRSSTCAADERGVLGLPALLALEAFRWAAEGALRDRRPGAAGEIRRRGERVLRRGDAGHGGAGRLRATVRITLHRGYRRHRDPVCGPKLRQEIGAALLEPVWSVPATKRVTGVGHSVDVESIDILPEVRLRIGGFETPAPTRRTCSPARRSPPGSETTATWAWICSARPGASRLTSGR